MEPLPPTIANVLDAKTLKWVFVGGKGGVGKTTCSSSLAVQLAGERRSVLLLSTDPAHNLSDAFSQQFTSEPTLINGFDNLFAMEIDTTSSTAAELEALGSSGLSPDLLGGMPGMDEAMSMAEVFKLVRTLDYEVIVFDTAPTGHTLRLLSMPPLLDKMLGQFLNMRNKMGGMLGEALAGMLGENESEEDVLSKLAETKEIIQEVMVQFKDPDLTTFVCVCIPEFLSVYETERMIQELAGFEIDVRNIVVNQIVFPTDGSTCKICKARVRMQNTYLEQIDELYEDFHVIKMPQLPREVRGIDDLRRFSGYLLHPFQNTLEEQKMWDEEVVE